MTTHADTRQAARAADARQWRAAAEQYARFFAYGQAAHGEAPDGTPALCRYAHRRGAPAAFLVGPVPLADPVLACGDHLEAAVLDLAALLPRAAVTRAIPVKPL